MPRGDDAAQACLELPRASPEQRAVRVWARGDDVGVCLRDVDDASDEVCAVAALPEDRARWGVLRNGAKPPKPDDAPARMTRAGAHSVEVCPASGQPCATLKTEGAVDSLYQLFAAYHPRLKRVAVLTSASEAEVEQGVYCNLEIFDLTTKTRLARVPASRDVDYGPSRVVWLGDHIGVFTDVGAGPGGALWWADGETGEARVDLAPMFNAYDAQPVFAGDGRWAVLSWDGREVVLADVEAYRVRYRIDLELVFPELEDGEYSERNAITALSSGRVVVALGGAQAGDLWTLDPDGSTRVWRAPRCAAPSGPGGDGVDVGAP